MLKIFGDEIAMTRGDTVRMNLSLVDARKNPYELKEGDTAYFTVKKDSEVVISKEVSEGEIVIYPNDTASLEYGTYDYDVEVALGNGDINTVIVSTISICREVKE